MSYYMIITPLFVVFVIQNDNERSELPVIIIIL